MKAINNKLERLNRLSDRCLALSKADNWGKFGESFIRSRREELLNK